MTSNARSRTAILALACLGHAVLIVLLARGIDGARYRVPTREPEPLRLVLLDSLTRPDRASARMPAPELVPPSDAITLPIPDIDATGAALAPSVSDSMPSVDWIDERRREVASVAARERGGNSRAVERIDDRCGSTQKPRQHCRRQP